jgi:hypothetical protein
MFEHRSSLDPLFDSVQPGAVYERREDGRWSAGTIFAKMAAFEARDRFYAAAVILQAPGSPPPSPAPPPPHMVWMTEATRDDTLADVLTFLRGEPDWFDLYKAFELMRDDINSKLGQNKYEHTIVGAHLVKVALPRRNVKPLRDGMPWM